MSTCFGHIDVFSVYSWGRLDNNSLSLTTWCSFRTDNPYGIVFYFFFKQIDRNPLRGKYSRNYFCLQPCFSFLDSLAAWQGTDWTVSITTLNVSHSPALPQATWPVGCQIVGWSLVRHTTTSSFYQEQYEVGFLVFLFLPSLSWADTRVILTLVTAWNELGLFQSLSLCVSSLFLPLSLTSSPHSPLLHIDTCIYFIILVIPSCSIKFTEFNFQYFLIPSFLQTYSTLFLLFHLFYISPLLCPSPSILLHAGGESALPSEQHWCSGQRHVSEICQPSYCVPIWGWHLGQEALAQDRTGSQTHVQGKSGIYNGLWCIWLEGN